MIDTLYDIILPLLMAVLVIAAVVATGALVQIAYSVFQIAQFILAGGLR